MYWLERIRQNLGSANLPEFFASSNESVVTSAITALGHIARRHGKLDKDIAFAALEEVKTRFPSLEGVIADTFDDIEAFT